MIEVPLIVLVLGVPLLAAFGILVGRRSQTANKYADYLQEQLDRAKAKLEENGINLD